MIERAGYRVVEAAGASEAILLLEQREDICCIFTDVDMPGSMDGLALAHTVRDRWPPIRIVVTSGLQYPTTADLPAGSVFVPKPYSSTTVLFALGMHAREIQL